MTRCLLFVLLLPLTATAADPLAFRLTFAKDKRAEPFTGRAYVMLFKGARPTLAGGPAWFNTEPFFAVDVKNIKPGDPIVVDKSALGYPMTLDKVPAGRYTVQAVIDLAPNAISFARGDGNLYAIKTGVEIDPAKGGTVAMSLDRVFASEKPKDADRVKFVEIESKLLSDFHGRPTTMRAGVVLPASFAKNPTRSYPAVYEIPGFSGTHLMAARAFAAGRDKVDGVDVVHVTLDPSCRHGHHVFADSANNGPVGKALVEELIPALEKKFRLIPKPGARLVTGHSSGGWSSLWLQVTYPEFFGGCWSTAPDPVTFADFQRIDLSDPKDNMFTDKDGKRRPIARRNGEVLLWYKDFSDMEVVMGHGGQLASFEAVFSGRGSDGQPLRVWDRKTGKIDTAVSKTWEKYDIRLVLQREWKNLGPKLAGKVRVYMGEEDNFYLEGATKLLRKAMKEIGSDAKIELFPGKDHSNLMDPAMRKRIAAEMAAVLRANKVAE